MSDSYVLIFFRFRMGLEHC